MNLSGAFLVLLAFASASAFPVIEEECLNYTIYPVQYDLTIIPYIFKDRSYYYDCELSITVIANAPYVQKIELDAKQFEIRNIGVFYGTTNLINSYRPYEYNSTAQQLYIYLKEPMMQYSVSKAQYNIKISFKNIMRNDGTGIILVPYDDGGRKFMITTRLSPNSAKFFFPCFDNPRFEAVFKFRVYFVPTRVGVEYFNNSLVISQETKRDGLQDNAIVVNYAPSPQVALHQVGFHYSQFGSRQVSAKKTNDVIVLWAPPHKLQYYEFILNFGKTILDLIHSYAALNPPRPLLIGPINLVAVPLNVDGYEIGSWNLLTNGDSRLAYVEQFTSIKQREAMMFELTQQLCRIWLGNPGEPKRTRWQEEWFKEGVATYLAHYLMAQYEHDIPSMKYKWPTGIYGLQMKNIAMAQDWRHTTPSLASLNRTLAVEIPSEDKALVMMKTASLLWMIENWLGSEKFHMALVKYINARRGLYISLNNFMDSLDLDTVECQQQFFNGSTASRILKSWFHQSGYPVINVNVLRDRTPNAIQLKQHKFSYSKVNRGDSHYLIPISYVVQDNENCFNCLRPRFTIDQTYTFEENLNGGWIILNRNASGYYRVNYDPVTWMLIAKTLKENRLAISEQNRAQIVNDVFALYAAGDMDDSLALEVLSYLDIEFNPIVWDSVIAGFQLLTMEDAPCNMTKYLYKDWQQFMRHKVAPIYSRLAGDIEQDRTARLFRSHIINFACSIQYQPCLKDLNVTYKNFVSAHQKLDPDSREACYYMIFQNKGNFGKNGFNSFEIEDKIIAEHRLADENRFQYRIPLGSPQLSQLRMSTTTAPYSTAVTDKIVEAGFPGGAPISSMASMVTALIAALIIVAVR